MLASPLEHDKNSTASIDPVVQLLNQEGPVTTCPERASAPMEPAALACVDSLDDGPMGDPSEDPTLECGLPHITQEEEIDPPVLDNLAHQMSRVADDSTEAELFNKITGHEWQKGVLMFRFCGRLTKVQVCRFRWRSVTFHARRQYMFLRTSSGVLTGNILVVATCDGHANSTVSIQKYSAVF
jgi:hypothetical protein